MTRKGMYIFLLILLGSFAPLPTQHILLPPAAIAQETPAPTQRISKEDQMYNAGKGIVLILVIAGWIGAVTLFGKYYKRKTLDKVE